MVYVVNHLTDCLKQTNNPTEFIKVKSYAVVMKLRRSKDTSPVWEAKGKNVSHSQHCHFTQCFLSSLYFGLTNGVLSYRAWGWILKQWVLIQKNRTTRWSKGFLQGKVTNKWVTKQGEISVNTLPHTNTCLSRARILITLTHSKLYKAIICKDSHSFRSWYAMALNCKQANFGKL